MKTSALRPGIPGEFCWVTYAFNDLFIPGVEALMKSLGRVKTRYPLVCMIGPSVGLENQCRLEALGISALRLSPTDVIYAEGSYSDRYSAESHLMFTKLNFFRLLDIEYGVYVDADMICLENPDMLFERRSLSMVPLNKHRAGTDQFSAGLVGFSPATSQLHSVSRFLSQSRLSGNTDQTLLNRLFKGQIEVLPKSYNIHYKDLGVSLLGLNFGRSLILRNLLAKRAIHFLHFDGQKPWIDVPDLKLSWAARHNLPFRLWHEIYNA